MTSHVRLFLSHDEKDEEKMSCFKVKISIIRNSQFQCLAFALPGVTFSYITLA